MKNTAQHTHCSMPECGEELPPRAMSSLCKNCRASMRIWRNRGLRDILARRQRLKKYDSRMERAESETVRPTRGKK